MINTKTLGNDCIIIISTIIIMQCKAYSDEKSALSESRKPAASVMKDQIDYT